MAPISFYVPCDWALPYGGDAAIRAGLWTKPHPRLGPLNFNSVHKVLLPGLCSVHFSSLLSARTFQVQDSMEGSDASQVRSSWLVRPCCENGAQVRDSAASRYSNKIPRCRWWDHTG